ncbi:hypothetical protein [Pseudoduganella sp. OTU4001]|uniref:hypothetical protein n=1 Tax=Pseudoduganella sp. OTU4001 TaxID=3043854 RepID=UPI00313D8DEC
MSLIHKVESAYLQLLRILFLIFATVAIGFAVLLGVQYMARHNAKPEPVNEKIVLSAASYKVHADSEAPRPSQEKGIEKDALFEQFSNMIVKVGKSAVPDFSVNREAVRNIYDQLLHDPKLGRDFIEQTNKVLPQIAARPEVTARLQRDVGGEFDAILGHLRNEYKEQGANIGDKKAAAESEATELRASATQGLYGAGSLFVAFVGLILLVVLLKIERNLRSAKVVASV